MQTNAFERGCSPPAHGDPLAKLTKKQLWFECVWYSDESTSMKLLLLRIGSFFKRDGTASSMAVSQIVRDCNFSEATAKRCLKRARDFWLKVEVQKGFWTHFGRQNLYHAILPPAVLEGLREYRAQQQEARRPDLAAPACAAIVQRLRAVNREGGLTVTPPGGVTMKGVTQIQTPTGKVEDHKERSANRRGICGEVDPSSADVNALRPWGST
jgi:hypothetical protein